MRRYLIKLFLIAVLAVFCFFDYNIGALISSKNEISNGIISKVPFLSNIKQIAYYQNPFNKDDYLFFIYTKNEITVAGFFKNSETYTAHLTESEISVLKLSSYLSSVEFEEKKPIAWWLYIIVFFVIIFFPRLKKKNDTNPGIMATLDKQMPKSTTSTDRSEIINLKKDVRDLKEIVTLKEEIQDLKEKLEK